MSVRRAPDSFIPCWSCSFGTGPESLSIPAQLRPFTALRNKGTTHLYRYEEHARLVTNYFYFSRNYPSDLNCERSFGADRSMSFPRLRSRRVVNIFIILLHIGRLHVLNVKQRATSFNTSIFFQLKFLHVVENCCWNSFV